MQEQSEQHNVIFTYSGNTSVELRLQGKLVNYYNRYIMVGHAQNTGHGWGMGIKWVVTFFHSSKKRMNG